MNHSLVARARYSLWTPWVIPQTTKLASPTTEETKNHCNVDFIEPNSFTHKKLGGLLTLSPKPERLKNLLFQANKSNFKKTSLRRLSADSQQSLSSPSVVSQQSLRNLSAVS